MQYQKKVGIIIAISGTLLVGTNPQLLVPVLLACLLITTAQTQSVSANPMPAAPAAKSRVVPYRYRTHPAPNQARLGLAQTWGVDSLRLKLVESGEIIRFTYRVLDPEKAEALMDKKNSPSLIDPGTGVKLPASLREKSGELGQDGAPEVGRVYTMAFPNLGRSVQPGHRVSVIVGQFRAEGLLVQ